MAAVPNANVPGNVQNAQTVGQPPGALPVVPPNVANHALNSSPNAGASPSLTGKATPLNMNASPSSKKGQVVVIALLIVGLLLLGALVLGGFAIGTALLFTPAWPLGIALGTFGGILAVTSAIAIAGKLVSDKLPKPANGSGTPANPPGTPANPAGTPANPAGAPANPAGTPANPAGAPASALSNAKKIALEAEKKRLEEARNQLTNRLIHDKANEAAILKQMQDNDKLLQDITQALK